MDGAHLRRSQHFVPHHRSENAGPNARGRELDGDTKGLTPRKNPHRLERNGCEFNFGISCCLLLQLSSAHPSPFFKTSSQSLPVLAPCLRSSCPYRQHSRRALHRPFAMRYDARTSCPLATGTRAGSPRNPDGATTLAYCNREAVKD